ncbi:MAG: tripartite tricarboxylate transporter TctB family protein [Candidatus Rokuibacteriota bacterium]
MPLRHLERVAAAAGVMLGFGAYAIARSFPTGPHGWMDDPSVWPKTLAAAMAALSVLLLLRPDLENRRVAFAGAWRGLLLLVGTAAYLWALPRAGYFSASALWLLGVAVLGGERRWPTIIAASVVLTLVGYLLFWKVMVIALPTGAVDDWLGLARLYR